jgi:hypothetical protein
MKTSLADGQHHLPHDMSLFNPLVRVNDSAQRKHLGPERNRLGTNCSIQPVNSRSRHLTIASKGGMAWRLGLGSTPLG